MEVANLKIAPTGPMTNAFPARMDTSHRMEYVWQSKHSFALTDKSVIIKV